MFGLNAKYLAVAGVSGACVGLGCGMAHSLFVSPTHNTAAAMAAGKSAGSAISCDQFHVPIYVAVRMNGASTITAAGLVADTSRQVKPGAQATTLVNATEEDGSTQVSLTQLDANPGVGASGIVYAQSSDPSMRSCDYKLAGSAEDQLLVQAAKTALQSSGTATSQQLSGSGDIYLVSDDPIDPSQVIVTIDVPANLTLANGSQSFSDEHFVAIVDKTSLAISETAIVPSV